MNIIGISAFYHDAACCLLQDGQVTAAALEERFSRVKHDARLPVQAYRYCLQAGGLSPADIDAIAYYEDPVAKLSRQLWAWRGRGPEGDLAWLDPGYPGRAIREYLGFSGPIRTFAHHLAHAASAYYFSGFADAAILTVDGVGEWTTLTHGRGRDAGIELLTDIHFPHSLGLLYAALTAYLGFPVNEGEFRVMGLAAYGRPVYADKISRLIQDAAADRFELDLAFFDFIDGDTMYSPQLIDLLGQPARPPGAELTTFHENVAASLQVVLEEILLAKCRYLFAQVGSDNLCLAGGVALNCVANGRISREGPFARVFIPPAPHDAGGCLGAAALAHTELTGRRPAAARQRHDYFGPAYGNKQVTQLLTDAGIAAQDFGDRRDDLLSAVVDRLVAGQFVGWFQGAMEFGPRALGARSILANPQDPTARDRLNERKGRESFRPFAPSVLADHAAAHFDLRGSSPFMLQTCQVISALDLPAITHVDGSARPQTVTAADNPRFAALIGAFYQRTGCPLLLNTSFNRRGEPIVCTPADAVLAMATMRLDALVIEDRLIDLAALPAELVEGLAGRGQPAPAKAGARTPLGENLYTFV